MAPGLRGNLISHRLFPAPLPRGVKRTKEARWDPRGGRIVPSCSRGRGTALPPGPSWPSSPSSASGIGSPILTCTLLLPRPGPDSPGLVPPQAAPVPSGAAASAPPSSDDPGSRTESWVALACSERALGRSAAQGLCFQDTPRGRQCGGSTGASGRGGGRAPGRQRVFSGSSACVLLSLAVPVNAEHSG